MEKIRYLIFIAMLVLFYILIYKDIKYINKFRMVDYKDSLFSVVNSTHDRGDIILNDSLLVKASIPILEYPKNFLFWDASKPVISFTNKEYQYKLGDIKIPYLLTKKKSNDTLYAIKNNDTLLLLLSAAEY